MCANSFTSIGSTALLILNRLQCQLRVEELSLDLVSDESEKTSDAARRGKPNHAGVGGVIPELEIGDCPAQIADAEEQIPIHSTHHAGENDPQEQDKPAQTADEQKEESHRRFVMQRIRDFAAFERRFDPQRSRRTKID